MDKLVAWSLSDLVCTCTCSWRELSPSVSTPYSGVRVALYLFVIDSHRCYEAGFEAIVPAVMRAILGVQCDRDMCSVCVPIANSNLYICPSPATHAIPWNDLQLGAVLHKDVARALVLGHNADALCGTANKHRKAQGSIRTEQTERNRAKRTEAERVVVSTRGAPGEITALVSNLTLNCNR